MPLIINEELPAYDVLRKEHVFVVNPYRAVHQDLPTADCHFEPDA